MIFVNIEIKMNTIFFRLVEKDNLVAQGKDVRKIVTKLKDKSLTLFCSHRKPQMVQGLDLENLQLNLV